MSKTETTQGRLPGERRPILQSADDIFEIAVKLGLFFFLVYWSTVLLRPFLSIALLEPSSRRRSLSGFLLGGSSAGRAAQAGGRSCDGDQPSGLHRADHLAGDKHDRGRG